MQRLQYLLPMRTLLLFAKREMNGGNEIMKCIKMLSIMVLALLISVPALAAGRINVTQENYYTIKEGNYYYGYVFSKVENNGNKPIKINNALLEVFDIEGDPITSTDSFSAYARYLEPGEYTYVSLHMSIKELSSIEDVDDYMLTISGKSDIDMQTIRLDCECEYKENVQSGYYTYNYMYATITNNTDKVIYQPSAVFVLLDSEDNILYLMGDKLDSNVALMPGGSILFREAVDNDFVKYMDENNLIPVSLDVIAFAYIDLEE